MPRKLATRMDRVSPSATMEIRRRAEELRRAGADVIDLGPGEPDFDTPEPVRRAGIAAIEAGHTGYTQAGGIPALREAIVARYRRDYGVSYTSDEVIVAAGAKQALFSLALALFDEGDEVLIPVPYWVTYPEVVRLCGAEPVFVPTHPDDGFHLVPEAVAERVGPRTVALIVNSPCNPTGALLGPDELEAIVELARAHDFYVIFDEAYEAIVYERGPFSAAPLKDEHVIVVGSLSKSHAMPGWRIGWALGPREVIRAALAIQSHSITHPASISQYAALEALEGPWDGVGEMVTELRRRRDLAAEALNRIPGVECPVPEGAFYLFPDFSRYLGGDTVALAGRLLEEAHVAVVPGEAFGWPGRVRISLTRPRELLREAVSRMAATLEGLRD